LFGSLIYGRQRESGSAAPLVVVDGGAVFAGGVCAGDGAAAGGGAEVACVATDGGDDRLGGVAADVCGGALGYGAEVAQ